MVEAACVSMLFYEHGLLGYASGAMLRELNLQGSAKKFEGFFGGAKTFFGRSPSDNVSLV